MSIIAMIAQWSFPVIILTNVFVGCGAYMVCFLFWRTRGQGGYQEKVDDFLEKMRTPVVFSAEIGKDVDFQQFRIIGLTSIIVAACILSLLLIPGSHSRVPYFFVSGFIGAIGVLFFRYSFTLKKRAARRSAAQSALPEGAAR